MMKTLVVLSILLFMFICGYTGWSMRPNVILYTPQQIDELIKRNIILTNIIAGQVEFEQSIVKAKK